jgi:hypothetical protein
MLYEGLEAMGHECYIFTSYDEKLDENNNESTNKRVINFKGHPYPFKNLKDYRFNFSHKKAVKLIKNYCYKYLCNGKVESRLVDMVVIESNEDKRYPKYGFIFDHYTNRVIQVIGNKK